MAVPGTPSALSDFDAAALRRVAYDSKLKVDTVLPSVFTQLKSAIKIENNEVNVLEKGVLMDVSNVGKAQSGQSVIVGMRQLMRKRAKYGPAATVLGNEDEQKLLYTTLYYNEIKKGIKNWGRGYNYNDTEYLNFVETSAPALAMFMAENFDARCNQALLLTYADELVAAPVSKAQVFNSNWCIPNLAEGSYPAWENTAETQIAGAADADEYYSSRIYGTAGTAMSENIADALIAASGVAATSKCLMKTDWVAQLSYYLSQVLRIEPIMLDGMVTYPFLIHPAVKAWMMNPANTSSPASNIANIMEYKDPKRMTIPGEFGRLFENLLCITNSRAPTLKLTGDNGSWALRPGYVWPGNNDDRTTGSWTVTSGSQNLGFYINYALGANALARYLRDDLVTNLSETTEYGFIKGLAAYIGEGIQIPRWDIGTPVDTAGSVTMVQKGSCVVPCSFAPIGTVA